VDHWLDLSRIEDGSFSRAQTPVSLVAIAEKSVEELAPLCQRRGIDLVFRPAADVPKALGDQESLVRVFTNVIGNAVKYTPSGGTISVGVDFDDYYVYARISDTGEGIPADKLPFIFEPFYRVKGKEDRQKGSGLGLTFVKKIMDAHAGKIDVTSKVGEGTTFVLTFPRLYEL
ncbi:MAG TPA: HAMP domain-containing sensor histidine kinase, partial [Deltaproteobacteria bacterium]|nr:HAMP domain-containing sensor histidine kinase [Deltaproteobacteria bacterium]